MLTDSARAEHAGGGVSAAEQQCATHVPHQHSLRLVLAVLVFAYNFLVLRSAPDLEAGERRQEHLPEQQSRLRVRCEGRPEQRHSRRLRGTSASPGNHETQLRSAPRSICPSSMRYI